MKMGTTHSPWRYDVVRGRARHSATLRPLAIALRRLGRLRLIYGLDPIENLAEIALGELSVIVVLQIEPKLRGCAERLG
jgi:hypothetical protein